MNTDRETLLTAAAMLRNRARCLSDDVDPQARADHDRMLKHARDLEEFANDIAIRRPPSITPQ